MGTHSDRVSAKIRGMRGGILARRMLAIDPGSNKMGWALYENGEMLKSGKIELPEESIQKRLVLLLKALVELDLGQIHTLVIEEIRGYTVHHYLYWSIGVVVCAVNPQVLLELPISLWRAIIPDDYVKTDERDARMIGDTTVLIARGEYGQVKEWRSKGTIEAAATKSRKSGSAKGSGKTPKAAWKDAA